MPPESETERNGFIITNSLCWFENNEFLLSPWKVFLLCPSTLSKLQKQESWLKNPLPKVSIWGPRGEVSACWERRRTRRCSRRLHIWCCGRPPSDGAGNSRLGKHQNFQFPGLSNLFWDKMFLDINHRRPPVFLFQFWILTGLVGWRNGIGCQWWSSLFRIGQLVTQEIGSLSKTTKL